MSRFIGIGNALVDVLVQIPDAAILQQLQLPKGSMQHVDYERAQQVMKAVQQFGHHMASGGSASNTIHGLARLGNDTAFIGHTGTDEIGMFFREDMEKAGIRPMLVTNSDPTGIAHALITPDGERTFATFLGAALNLNAKHLHAGMFDAADYLYVEGYLVQNEELIRKAMHLAKQCGLQVVLDLASYNVVEANRVLLDELLRSYVDIVFANEEEAKALTGGTPQQSLDYLAGVCTTAVVKLGANGAIVKHGMETVAGQAFDARVLDTTGAGDIFAAGFLHIYASGGSLGQALKAGALLGARVIEQLGPKLPETSWPALAKSLLSD
ncbi:MAG TPA: adenosine kinase [Bacteroidales bacterium]|nr:adenosine kinase [Bacteroidales bacterium]